MHCCYVFLYPEQQCLIERERERETGGSGNKRHLLRIYELAHFELFDALLWRVRSKDHRNDFGDHRVMEVLGTQRTQSIAFRRRFNFI
ncbi:hypothetical protein I7I48_08021 [Histoplasma ohiense]|nr:hypothetical protein I7I48_08021 [Histoplasma ohiense (nom. inval.)]